MSFTDYSWYSGRGTFRNGHSARAFDRVLGEPLPRQVTRGLEARPPSLDDPLCSSALRFQCHDRGLDDLGGDASPGKVVPDQGVPGAPTGEDLRPVSGETLVVDRPGPNHSSERLAARSRRNLGPRQPFRKLLLGEVTSCDRASRLRHRLVPDELTTHPPRARSVELHTDVEPSREDSLRRQRSPGLSFESHFDAPPRAREQAANPWRRPLRGQLRPPWPSFL